MKGKNSASTAAIAAGAIGAVAGGIMGGGLTTSGLINGLGSSLSGSGDTSASVGGAAGSSTLTVGFWALLGAGVGALVGGETKTGLILVGVALVILYFMTKK